MVLLVGRLDMTSDMTDAAFCLAGFLFYWAPKY